MGWWWTLAVLKLIPSPLGFLHIRHRLISDRSPVGAVVPLQKDVLGDNPQIAKQH